MNAGRTYRINVVSEMTGVPAATLRAWERRYGFPKPQRTDSRYRVYTEEDVAMVRRMKDLLQSGMAPSDSASLLINEASASQASVTAGSEANPHEASARRIVEAAKRMAVDAIEKEVRLALTLGDAVLITEQIFMPAMAEISARREAGEFTVAHEQIASEALTLAARQLLRLMPTVQARRTAVVVCYGTYERALDLYAVAFRCVEQGVRPEVLTMSLPPDALAAIVKERAPDLVALWVGAQLPQGGDVSGVARAFVEAAGGVPLLVGGEGLDSVASEFEAAGATLVRGEQGEQTQKALRETLASLP